jgi:hypothetical protein
MRRKARYDLLTSIAHRAGGDIYSAGKSLLFGNSKRYGSASLRSYRVRRRIPRFKRRMYARRRARRWRRWVKPRKWSRRSVTRQIKRVVQQETKTTYPQLSTTFTDIQQPQGPRNQMSEDGTATFTLSAITENFDAPASNAPFLQAIQQGDGEFDRSGRKVFVKKVFIRFRVSMDTPCDAAKQYFTVMVVKQSDPTRLTVQEVWKRPDTMATDYLPRS